MTEIAGMGGMLSNFYTGVDQRDARKFLSTCNVESSVEGQTPSRTDRAQITENELRDFLQKIMTIVLKRCVDDPKCMGQ